MSIILDGFGVSKRIRESLKTRVDVLVSEGKRRPKLVVVIVGKDPASQTYVASKAKQCAAVGFESEIIELSEAIESRVLLDVINRLNQDDTVDGILVQLPLPPQINKDDIIDAIDPQKDVDGLHPLNLGFLEVGRPVFVSCTPKGIMRLLDWYDIALAGRSALVIGRSQLVGKPVATLLTQKNATVTLAHSKTKNLQSLVESHEIIIVAIGKAKAIPETWFNKNHVLVDVGIHRIDGSLCGDVEPGAYDRVAFATPVPKGVGPMTIASLLENTLIAYNLKEQKHETR